MNRPQPAAAFDLPHQAKSLELEVRVGRLEVELHELRAAHELLLNRLTALQAQFDYLEAKRRSGV